MTYGLVKYDRRFTDSQSWIDKYTTLYFDERYQMDTVHDNNMWENS